MLLICFQVYAQQQMVVKRHKVERVGGGAETVLSPGDKLRRRVAWVKRSGPTTLISKAASDCSFRKKKNIYFKLLSSVAGAITYT
jgi:hypothetical protein